MTAWLLEHGVRAFRVALAALGLIVLLGTLALLAGGCSGAAMPVVTVPITVHCSWSVGAGSGGEASDTETPMADGEVRHERHATGSAILDADCVVENIRPTTSPSTSGQSTETGDITPSVSTSVAP